MTVIHSASDLKASGQKISLAIGFFDGVHLGHQQILRQTVSDARRREGVALVITFDCHPNSVVAPARMPPLIYSLPQKLRTIETLGADALLLIHFDKSFSNQTGEAFIHSLVQNLRPSSVCSVCVGANFVFGHKRGGNVELLKQLGHELGFSVHGQAAVSLDGKAVSSTRIREAIAAGELDNASQMLGRAYSFSGTVIHGDHLGRQLGFPTANLETNGLALPPCGVYVIHAEERSTPDSHMTPPLRRRGVLNIGVRPTVQNPTPHLRVEAHLFDFEGDLYGKELELTLGSKLRDEKNFPSLADLRAQIALDVEQARGRF